MNNLILIICILLSAVVAGLAIKKYVINKSSTPTTAPPQVSNLSKSLAQLITGSLNNSVEYFTLFPINIQQQIAQMLEVGDIAGVENLIKSQGLTLDQIINYLVNASEVNDISMITDPIVKQISNLMKAQNEVSGI